MTAMTEDEKKELRDLLARGLKKQGLTPEKILRDTNTALDEDSGQFYVTEHERIVFHLNPDTLPVLLYAYSAYEDFLDLTTPSHMSGRCYELIVKARSLYSDYQTAHPMVQSFMWFAKEYFDVSNRQAYAYYMKRDANLLPITQFSDEKDDQS